MKTEPTAPTMPIIDSDSHWVEPPETWTSRAPARFRDRVPRLERHPDGYDVWLVDGDNFFGRFGFSVVKKGREKVYGLPTLPCYEDSDPSASHPKERLEMLDHLGLSAQILFPNVTGFGASEFFRNVKDPELRNLCATIYNDALVDLQSEGEGRLFPMAVVPFWDIDAAVTEIRRVKDLGLMGLAMCDTPEMAGAPALHDPHWDPLWSTVAEVELPVNFHVGGGKGGGRAHTAPWPGMAMEQYMTVMPADLFLSNGQTIANLIISGLLDRYPTIRFISSESGVGFIPFLLEALDYQSVEAGLEAAGTLEMKPSEYFRRQIYTSFWFEKRSLSRSVELLGDTNIMFETDFPHPACLYPEPGRKALEHVAKLPEASQRRLLYENVMELYRLPDTALGAGPP
jgi:predicted TIM-barrel fold metal-dependent hydrolase